ncbi:MAG: hypothetical protein K2Y39_13830 [Candidatus Obscuribacterales bacterium]|nr:hypothetical protein [Candidatus Obscuribacterales bacterium]
MNKTPGKTPAAREKYWTKIIEAARKYPDGITAYCRAMNVEKNNYYFWFKRLRPKHPDWHDLTNHPQPRSAKKKEANQEPGEPDPEVSVGARKRKWSAADKERILQETDGLSGPDLAAALRREGLYVHHLNKWRTERDLSQIAANKNAQSANARLAAENKRLKEANEKLQKKLEQANEIIDLQKKISQVWNFALDRIDET